MKVLRITAKRTGGFRRCGVHHLSTAVDHPIDRFKAKEIAVLKGEPQLIVQEVEVADKPDPQAAAGAASGKTTDGKPAKPAKDPAKKDA